MDLKDQVCSLELAKRICELGVKQESLWHWTKWKKWVRTTDNHNEYQLKGLKDFELFNNPKNNTLGRCWFEDVYSAFTVAELGERLPSRIEGIGFIRTIKWHNKHFSISIGNLHEQNADTEANARAKMLIYLLENKLIEEGK